MIGLEAELEDVELRLYQRDEFQQRAQHAGFVDIIVTRPDDDCGPGPQDRSTVHQCARP
jgi:hypothetical protein